MNKFQIAEISGEQAHAGTKATEDVITIGERMGFEPVHIRMQDLKQGFIHKLKRQFQFYKDWLRAYRTINEGAIVLLQHPFHYPQLTREKILLKLKKKKHARFISIVHDVEELRTLEKRKYYNHEFEFMMKIADVLIVHNNVMRDFFIKKGVSDERIVVLGIFDYIMDDHSSNLPVFKKMITIAGNLDIKKSGYLVGLSKVDCAFCLYGPNYCLEKTDNVSYGGVLSPEKVSKVLTKGFGLIWDGNSIETCEGGFGDYLRFNNPHKLSLYLSSGLPVIIWKYAAEAKFVEENEVGYVIESLQEISQLMNKASETEYVKIAENTRKISKKLIKGEYMMTALNHALKIICIIS